MVTAKDPEKFIGYGQLRLLREHGYNVEDLRDKRNAINLSQVSEDDRNLLLAERPPVTRTFGITSRQRHISTELMQDLLPELADFMPTRISLETLRRMRRDPMIQLALHYIKMPLMSAKWKIEGPDDAEAAFIEWALDRVWHKVLNNLLLSLDFGFVATIKRWEYERPAQELGLWSATADPVVPSDFFSLPPEQVQPRFTRGGRFNGVIYTPNTYGGSQNIPDQYVLWHTNDLDASFGNLFGFPRIGFAHAYWRSYWFRWLLYDRHFEQDADPPVIVKGPSGTYSDSDGNTYNYRDDGLALAESVRAGGSAYLPSEPFVDLQSGRPTQSPQWSIEYMFGGENIEQFQMSFEYLDVLKLRSVLVPEQALVEGKGGTSSRNVAATYSRIFAESQDVLMREIDRSVNQYLVDKIAIYNFGRNPGDYRKVTESLYDKNHELMSLIMQATVNTGKQLDARLDLVGVANALGLPLLTEEEVQTIKEEKQQELLANAEAQARMAQTFSNTNDNNSQTGNNNQPDSQNNG